MQRAHSVFETKSIDEDRRILEGIATTPTPDRIGDVVEPLGAQFSLPMPFLWQHGKDPFVGNTPVGHVIYAKPTKNGIPVRIQMERSDEPGRLKDILDFTWQVIKKGLVRGLSIGFHPIGDPEPIKGSFGLRFPKWDWMELSGVTIPMNVEGNIQTVKQFDTDAPATTGTVLRVTKSPGASGPVKVIHTRPGVSKMDLREQIRSFEATSLTKSERMNAIQEKASKEGRTKDDAEQEEFDTLKGEIASIAKEVKDLQDLEAQNVAQAKPVDPTPTIKAGSDSRGTIAVVKAPEKLEPGIEFARYAMCLAAAKGNVPQALALAQTHYPQQQRAINVLKSAAGFGMSMRRYAEDLITKTDVAAGTTSHATWAGPLLDYNTFTGDFLEYLRAETILGKFGQNGVPDVRRIPFNVHIKGQTSGGTGYWVGEGKPKPVTKFDFNDTYHGFTKVAAIAVLTEELIRFSNPSAERLVRDALAGCLIERIDTDLVDPAVGAVAGVNPASLLNGVASIQSSGDTADDVRTDIQALWAAAIAANLPLTSAVYITTPSVALALSLMMNSLGQREFPNMSMSGGTLLGVPVIVSNYVDAGNFILVFASEIWLSDDGQVTIDASDQASIQMMDNPTNASDVPTHTTHVSMYQTDSVALRAHRFINWSKRRTTAVRWLNAVSWGGAAS